MPAVQKDYGPMKPNSPDTERRKQDRASSPTKLLEYVEGELVALSALTFVLVRPPIMANVSAVDDSQAEPSSEVPIIDIIEERLSQLPVEPPCAPTNEESAAHFNDGWNRMIHLFRDVSRDL